MNLDWIQSEENSLIYIGDTLCSWCYGFAPELDKFIANHPELKLRMVQGGLRPFGKEMLHDMKDFLQSHYTEIENRTGQPFDKQMFEKDNFVVDTEPASRAVVVCRMMNPEKELDFFKAVQVAFYTQTKNINELSTFIEVAESLGLDTEKYAELFNSEEAKYATKTDFQLSSEMGVKGFPSVILKLNGQFFMISNGYREVADLEEVYQNVQKELAK
ncbi:MAG: DsbA family protein [Flavobacteriales bacterium]